MLPILPAFSLIAGAWALVSGILHDVFVLRSEHGKKYDRNLLRLLMDGHILITCGTMQMISFIGLQQNESWSFYVAATACISLLVYCALIFPFLKSLFTITINLLLLALLATGFAQLHV